MNRSDEEIRDTLNDTLTAAGVDVRNLAIEGVGGRATITGSVPEQTQRQVADWPPLPGVNGRGQF